MQLAKYLTTKEKINLFRDILELKDLEKIAEAYEITIKNVKMLCNILLQYKKENGENFDTENVPDIIVDTTNKLELFYFNLFTEIEAETFTILELETLTEDETDEFFKFLRFKNGVYCIHCGYMKIYELRNGALYKCGKCRKCFTIRSKTIFKRYKIPISFYLQIIFLKLKYCSDVQIAGKLGITQTTAWKIKRKLLQVGMPTKNKLNIYETVQS